MEALASWFKNGWDWLCQQVANASANVIGTGLASTGIFVKEFAVIIIMLGVLLWMCRYTKVFRYGMIGYVIGFILELLGSIIRV
ncbi:MAG: hypothetical protein ACRCUM_04205 [Mycoplasmoidaceae bacterium]